MNTDTPESGGTSRLNFGGSSPFTSGQTEPLTDPLPTEDVAESNVPATDVGLDQMPEDNISTPQTELEADVAAIHEKMEDQAEPVVEQVTETVTNSDEVATENPAVEIPTEAPVEPTANIETEIAPVEQAAATPAEIPAEAPVIAATTDGEIDKAIAERDALNAKIEEGQKAQRVDVITQIKNVVNTYKIPLNELAEALGIKGTRKGSKAKPKYKDPASDKTWSGRGKEPLWIKGQDRSRFLIV